VAQERGVEAQLFADGAKDWVPHSIVKGQKNPPYLPIDFLFVFVYSALCMTESGVGGETQKGLQPYGLWALV